MGFLGLSVVNSSPAMQCLGREDSPGEESDNPLRYSCLGNPMDRGAWRATVQEAAKELDMISN